MVSKKGKILLWVLLVIVIGMLSVNMYLNVHQSDFTQNERPRQRKTYLQREEINKELKEIIVTEKMQQVIDLYSTVTGDASLAARIIDFALTYEVPVSLLFSIISVESEFNPKALNKNSNGTYDYGLMSLNSRTFKKYSSEQLYNIDTNLKLGCEYLLWLKKKYVTWGEAVIHYNGLYTKGAGSYMVKVMEREREYERLFNEQL